MQQLKLRGNKVCVERLKKQSKQENQLFVMPDTNDSVGIIRYVGEGISEDLVVGQKVYFGDKLHNLRMAGQDLLVMEDSNVFVIVQE